jgi:hypothetical protein
MLVYIEKKQQSSQIAILMMENEKEGEREREIK